VNAIRILSVSVLVTLTLSIAPARSMPADQSDYASAILQHDKVRALLAQQIALEKIKLQQIHELAQKYPGIDSTTIFQEKDLVTMGGIHGSRLRLKRFEAMTTEIDLIQGHYWRDWERAVNSNDLDQPLSGSIKISFRQAKPQIMLNYAQWLQAMRDNAIAISGLLQTAEHLLGTITWTGSTLKASNPAVLADLENSLHKVETAAQHDNEARHTALRTVDPTLQLIRAALFSGELST
jgi:hypothetical protein